MAKKPEIKMELRYDLRLKEVLSNVRKNCGEAVKSWGSDAAMIAKRLAPELTGEYKSEIGVEADGLKAVLASRGENESDMGIAGHLEMGLKKTREMKPQPHMRPAVILARDNIREKIGLRGVVKPGTKYK